MNVNTHVLQRRMLPLQYFESLGKETTNCLWPKAIASALTISTRIKNNQRQYKICRIKLVFCTLLCKPSKRPKRVKQRGGILNTSLSNEYHLISTTVNLDLQRIFQLSLKSIDNIFDSSNETKNFLNRKFEQFKLENNL